MSTFIWIAIIITVVYIIYYTVMIMNDLYGKKPEEKNKAEEIDVPITEGEAIPDEIPIAVVESDTGFNIGEDEYETNDVIDEQQESVTETVEEAAPEPEQKSVAESIRQKVEGTSEPIDVSWEDKLWEAEFRQALNNKGKGRLGRPTVKTELVHDEV